MLRMFSLGLPEWRIKFQVVVIRLFGRLIRDKVGYELIESWAVLMVVMGEDRRLREVVFTHTPLIGLLCRCVLTKAWSLHCHILQWLSNMVVIKLDIRTVNRMAYSLSEMVGAYQYQAWWWREVGFNFAQRDVVRLPLKKTIRIKSRTSTSNS